MRVRLLHVGIVVVCDLGRGYAFVVADPPRRNGNLKIPLPFDESIRAALEIKPPAKKPRKPRAKKTAKP